MGLFKEIGKTVEVKFRAFTTKLTIETKDHAVHFVSAIEAKAKELEIEANNAVSTGLNAVNQAITKDEIAALTALSHDFTELATHLRAKSGL